MEIISWVSTHTGQNRKLCLSAHSAYPGHYTTVCHITSVSLPGMSLYIIGCSWSHCLTTCLPEWTLSGEHVDF
jgi:hypothetical protein